MKKNTRKNIVLFCISTLLVSVAWWGYFCFSPLYFAQQSGQKNTQYFQNLAIGEIKIFDRNNFLISHLPLEDGFFIPLNPETEIPEKIQKALLLQEDKRFQDHWGVDVLSKIRATKSNMSSRKIVSGGSTITEQWIKNQYFRGNKRTLLQKMREATLSLYFSQHYSKEEILKKYLNSAYFGNNIYGIQSASFVYFQKSNLKSLNEEEISILLKILQIPSRAQNIYNFSGFSPKNKFPHITTEVLQKNNKNNKNNNKNQKINKYQKSHTFYTTIDSALQEKTKDFIGLQLESLRDKNVSNAAVFAFSPQTGEIFLAQGSKDFFSDEIDGQVNIIYQKRQMGSALKPFLYFLAFEDGATPEDYILDIEQSFYQESQSKAYHPLNYNLDEGGIVKLKNALSNSLNISAVQILQHITPKKFLDFLSDLGIAFDFPASHYGLSLALGSPDITLFEVANAYANLMKSPEEKTLSPHFFAQNTSKHPKTNNVRNTQKNTQKIFTQSQKFLWKTLSSQENRASSFGLNSVLNTTIPMMVKTGTTHNFKDNWVFAYHPDVVIAVWVGNNDSSPMKGVSGVSGAGPIFHFVAEEMNARKYFSTTIFQNPPEESRDKNININKDESDNFTESEKTEQIFCGEDFYLKNISQKDISKVQKIFGEHITIQQCKQNIQNTSPEKNLEIFSPQDNELFYLKKNFPIELQKILLSAEKNVTWNIQELCPNRVLHESENHTPYAKIFPNTSRFFWTPQVGKFSIDISDPTSKTLQKTLFIEVREF